jgi:hypothetical protein
MPDSIKLDDRASSMRTLKRFGMRAAIMLAFCAASAAPLGRIGLLAGMFALMCALFSVLLKERLAGPSLNHWDEAFAFLMISHGAHILERSAL